jgi:predicted nuclease with TOPRIM domain
MDIDDYINSLIKDNENLKNTVESLKNEIRTQRKEIAALREERRMFLDKDKGPNNVTWKENNNND